MHSEDCRNVLMMLLAVVGICFIIATFSSCEVARYNANVSLIQANPEVVNTTPLIK